MARLGSNASYIIFLFYEYIKKLHLKLFYILPEGFEKFTFAPN